MRWFRKCPAQRAICEGYNNTTSQSLRDGTIQSQHGMNSHTTWCRKITRKKSTTQSPSSLQNSSCSQILVNSIKSNTNTLSKVEHHHMLWSRTLLHTAKPELSRQYTTLDIQDCSRMRSRPPVKHVAVTISTHRSQINPRLCTLSQFLHLSTLF